MVYKLETYKMYRGKVHYFIQNSTQSEKPPDAVDIGVKTSRSHCQSLIR
jgi:hypothetical protein